MRHVRLRSGQEMPVLGQGTWGFGDSKAGYAKAAAALRLGLDLGISLDRHRRDVWRGGAEEIVGQAIAGRRDEAFIVSKVYPTMPRARARSPPASAASSASAPTASTSTSCIGAARCRSPRPSRRSIN